MALTLSARCKTNMLAQINAAAGTNAVLTIYSGTRPATGGTATTALAQFTCGSSAFGTVSGRVLTANTIGPTTATATGTATWARLKSSGGTFVADMSVGTSGAELILSTTSVSSGATLNISSCVISANNNRFNKVFYGLNGHFDYPESTATIIAALKFMGCTVYRMTYEGSQASMNAIVAMAQAFIADGTGLMLYVCDDLSAYSTGTTVYSTPTIAYNTGKAEGQLVANALAPYAQAVMAIELGNEMARKGNMVSLSYIMGTNPADFTQSDWFSLANVCAGATDGVRSVLPNMPVCNNALTFAEYAVSDMLWNGTNPNGSSGNPPIKWDITALHSYQSWGDPVNISYDGDGTSRFDLYSYLANAYQRPLVLSEWGADATGPDTDAQQNAWNQTMLTEMYARRESLGGPVQIRSCIMYELYNTDYNWGVIAQNTSTTLTGIGGTLKNFIAANPDT